MSDVRLRPWAEGDLPLLLRANTPEMTAHLGGPQPEEAILARHERFLRLSHEGTAAMFAIVTPDGPEGVGSIGWWEHEFDAEPALETGWHVDIDHQGRGIAKAALLALLDDLRARGETRPIYAYPRVSNAASNALCRGTGFSYVGERAFEFPAGVRENSAIWVIRFD